MFQLFQLLINKHINSYSRIKNHDPFFELTFFAFSTRSSVIGKETYKASTQSRELHEEEEEADKKKHETITCL